MKKINLSIFILLFLVGCVSESVSTNAANVTPTPITLEEGFGGMRGSLIVPQTWKDMTIYVYAAPYIGDPESEGAYMVDDRLIPWNTMDAGGTFQIANIPPGIYILVAGADVETAKAYRVNERAVKYTVKENEVLELGEISFLGN